MLFVDAGGDKVGINENSPASLLHLTGTENVDNCQIYMMENNTYGAFIKYDGLANRGSLGGLTPGENEVMAWSRSGTDVTFNDDGLDMDFFVESNNNTGMLFVDAGKDTVRLGNGGGNSAPLSFHKGKSSRYFGKYIDSTAAAAAKVATLMTIDSWQSGNSRLFGTVTFWSVNPVGDYANHGRASFFAKNTVSGTGNTVTTFTELEEKGTMALPTLTWTGTGLTTLTFNMPAVAYQKWLVDITFVSADGATTTLYDEAATGVDP